MNWELFLFGMLGALLTVYLAKHEVSQNSARFSILPRKSKRQGNIKTTLRRQKSTLMISRPSWRQSHLPKML